MLKDQSAVDHVEGRGGKRAEVGGSDHVETATGVRPVQVAGARDHRARHVHAVHRFEMIGERPGDPPDAAAEIQRAQAAGIGHNPDQVGDESQSIGAAGREKCVDVPGGGAGAGKENRAERIAAAERVPVRVEAAQIHARDDNLVSEAATRLAFPVRGGASQ